MTNAIPKNQTKTAKVEQLLSRAKGVSIEEICKVTGWNPPSVRALLTGLRKKGFEIVREWRGEDDTAFRITKKPASEKA